MTEPAELVLGVLVEDHRRPSVSGTRPSAPSAINWFILRPA
ncbi:MAG: hypothetical protein R2710_14595 [Acidimicrobiales bacterium]